MKRGISTILVALLVLVIVFAAVAAYGWLRPTPTSTTYTPVTMEEKAKQEGALTIYGVMDTPDFVAKIRPAFEAQYPWAAGMISYVGFAPGEESTRVLSEYQSGHVQADVAICTMGSLTPALLGGASETWTNPMAALMNYSSGTYDPNGVWQIGFELPIILEYNTHLVNASMVPTTWQDLTNPYWNNKISIDDPKTNDVFGTLAAHLYPILGNASWTALMQGISANHPLLSESAGEAYTKVASGEAAIGVGLINDYLAGLITPGINVSLAWIEPVTALPVPSMLCKNAPHPNFGKLFLEWFASGPGQYSIASSGRVPSNGPIAAGTILKGVVPSNVSIVLAASNNPDFYSNPSKWSDTYRSIFG